MLMVIYNSLFKSTYPQYVKELFNLRNTSYSLRGEDILSAPTCVYHGQQIIDWNLYAISKSIVPPKSKKMDLAFRQYENNTILETVQSCNKENELLTSLAL